jgi:hypothetical protein
LLHFRRPRHGHGELVEVHGVVAVGVHGGEELVDGVVEDEDAELLQRRPQPRADDGGLAVCRGAGGGMPVEGPTEVRGVTKRRSFTSSAGVCFSKAASVSW